MVLAMSVKEAAALWSPTSLAMTQVTAEAGTCHSAQPLAVSTGMRKQGTSPLSPGRGTPAPISLIFGA